MHESYGHDCACAKVHIKWATFFSWLAYNHFFLSLLMLSLFSLQFIKSADQIMIIKTEREKKTSHQYSGHTYRFKKKITFTIIIIMNSNALFYVKSINLFHIKFMASKRNNWKNPEHIDKHTKTMTIFEVKLHTDANFGIFLSIKTGFLCCKFNAKVALNTQDSCESFIGFFGCIDYTNYWNLSVNLMNPSHMHNSTYINVQVQFSFNVRLQNAHKILHKTEPKFNFVIGTTSSGWVFLVCMSCFYDCSFRFM